MFGKLVACLASMQQNVSHTKGRTFKIIVIHFTPRAYTFKPIAKSFTQGLILICYLRESWKQAKTPCFFQNGKKLIGRPKKKRKREQGERAPVLQEARMSCTVRCTSCQDTSTKVSYGDETFHHNMFLFRHQWHMVMKLHLSPNPCHRMFWWRKFCHQKKKMIGDEIFCHQIFSSLNLIFSDEINSSSIIFYL